MAYPQAFLDNLQRTGRNLVWYVESVPFSETNTYEGEGAPPPQLHTWTHGLNWKASNTGKFGDIDAKIVSGSLRLGASQLNIQTWRYSQGGFSFSIVDWTWAIRNLRRGFVMRLKLGFEGEPQSAQRVVAIGRLQRMTVRGAQMDIQVGGPLDLLVSRQTNEQDKSSYFESLRDVSTVLTSGYAPGNPTINVASTTGFERKALSAGAIRITKPSTGEFFEVTYTGETATTFTGAASSTEFSTPQIIVGAADSLVEPIAYLEGHPIAILRDFFSAKSGGAYAGYPAVWGVGMPRTMIANEHMTTWIDYLAVDAGNFDMRILVDSSKRDALTFFTGIMSRFGVFPVLYQGQYAAHAALDPRNLQNYDPITIGPEAVESVRRHDMWSTQQTYTAAGVRFITTDYTAGPPALRRTNFEFSSPKPPDLPCISREIRDLSDVIFEDPGTDNYRVDNLLRDTIGRWASIMPEEVELRIKDHRAVAWAVGQPVRLNHHLLSGRAEQGVAPYEDRHGIITGINPIQGSGGSVVVAVPPLL